MDSFILSAISIASIYTLAVVAPGPDFAITVRSALLYHKPTAFFTPIGIAVGILVHCCYCAMGLAWVISQSHTLFNIVQLIGAIYLIYIGIKTWLSNQAATDIQQQENTIRKKEAFTQGLFCNLFNPKAGLFILGIFAFAIKPNTPFCLEVIYIVEMVSITLIWFATVTICITHPKIQQKIISMQPRVAKILGGLLVLVGVHIGFQLVCC